MLFAVPRLFDYQGGVSMLGLGDIVLPGLLLSFASRYDESKRFVELVSGGSGRTASDDDRPRSCRCCGGGYFPPVMVAYAIGLLMANAAVYIMKMGQPALLYLVPCCLGTLVYMAHRAGELNDMWEGPRVIRMTERLMSGGHRVENATHQEEERREFENFNSDEEVYGLDSAEGAPSPELVKAEMT